MLQQQLQIVCQEYGCSIKYMDFLQRVVEFDCDLHKMRYDDRIEFLIKIENILEKFELKHMSLDNSATMH